MAKDGDIAAMRMCLDRLAPARKGESIASASFAQLIDQSAYYKLSSQFRGDGMKLDVFNGGPKNNLIRLKPDQDVSGQFWRLTRNGDGTFRLSTLFCGQGICLDIFNGGPKDNQPRLARCGNFFGQTWTLTKTDKRVEGVAKLD